jgi:hypothetical protein
VTGTSGRSAGRGGFRWALGIRSLLLALCVGGVAAAALPQPALARSTLTLRPSSGPPGKLVSVRGRGFGARKVVILRLGERRLARRRTSPSGSFKVSFVVPRATPGQFDLVARAGRRRALIHFNVTSPPGPVNPVLQPVPLAPLPPIVNPSGRRGLTPDTDPPTTPSGLTADRSSATIINLAWNASTDNVGVPAYEIFRDSVFLEAEAGTSFSDRNADPNTGHTYQVRAIDDAGNRSALSDAANVSAPTPQPTFPIRATFYYPWFPEAWNQLGINPYTKYHPSLGFYSSDDDAIRESHLQSLEYAKYEAGIYSWWGQGHYTDQRFHGMLAATNARHSPIKWALYYEREGTTDPTSDVIGADLDYIKSEYVDDPSYLKVGGKPVIFVYAGGPDACPMADRWAQANTAQRNFYVVLKVFAGYRTCTNQPQSWHQYAPSSRTDRQAGYSYAISPEFDLTGPDPQRLPRDLTAFQQAAASMVASNEPWQLVISFNEWGENTATESADEWASASGHGQYLDVLAGL